MLTADPAQDVLRSMRRPLDLIFAPKSVAVIGATDRPGSVGRTILANLLSNPFGGTVFPVNPKRPAVLGVKAYPTIAAVGERVELAIVVTPAATVPGVIRACAEAGVPGAIVISAGFRETGEAGAELERQVLAEARKGGMRIVGPNCLGVMNPHLGFNGTFAGAMANPGNLAFLSQSGALCTSILDWSFREHVGFSAFVSMGSMLDVGWGDWIYYLGDDPRTESIVIYMESIGDARSFLSAAREVAYTKPIIVIKAGRTAAAAQAATSHTGALTGSDEVLDAAFRRTGVLRVASISELFNMAEVLAKQPRPRGRRLTILTNAGGPGVLATDALVGAGGELAALSPETVAELDKLLPDHWSHGNPIDILGDAEPERYTQALAAAARDPGSDGLLVILTPQAMSQPTETARQLVECARELHHKPILASWMGGAEVAAGEALLNRAGVPTYTYPDTAARIFNYMGLYSYNLRDIYETPSATEADTGIERAAAEGILTAARQAGRTLLTEFEAKALLAAYGIPTVETRVAADEEAAVAAAGAIGYPVVVKLHSETITHKTDVQGVHLNLGDAEAVRAAYRAVAGAVEVQERAGKLQPSPQKPHFLGVSVQPMVRLDGYELILGSSIDAQFGPVLLFGTGGQLVEVFKDRALGLPPLNTTLARRMMEQTRIYGALLGVRGRGPVDLAALERLLVRFSQLVTEQPRIREIDINPLLARPGDSDAPTLIALDARVVLHPETIPDGDLPRPAIRPYPLQYRTPWTLRDGTEVLIEPIRPEDEPLAVHFHESLSTESVYQRYFQILKLSRRVAHERLARLCFIDYDREMALVAKIHDPKSGRAQIVAVGRLSKIPGTTRAEFSMMVSDRLHGQGLGTEMLKRLIAVARDENLGAIRAEILTTNLVMQRICTRLGFELVERPGDPVQLAVLELT
ncbi:bifunctional acetate--CoA ligase family protein/GNAT family N-acetyltransferase [Gloeobacter violaceus]|uniref:Glr1075 protein n=1 Tax=Gloeobacter violaceus (strain ATCC 29082 / PCC 7421) TaxID=251221 RepID=Q7NLP6_GLOVI|nr:bifunctional acetate--CoA ligase family protein/GNAT family N-acetyltransferase [Gloeobacter violaceus]BAC89016.1 glr1075 [Gloeobacter violaceus PCC 7421]